MQIFYIALLIVVGIFGAMFAIENPQLVDFGYFAGRADIALSLLLSATLGFGVVLGLLTGGYVRWRLRRRCRRLQERVRALEGPEDAEPAPAAGERIGHA